MERSYRSILAQHFMYLLCFVFTFSLILSSRVSALTPQQKLYKQNILYYDLDVCSDVATQDTTVGLTPGAGTPTGLTFPNLDPQGMATAINKYIENYNKTAGFQSVFTGLGATFVAGGKKSDVNPFVVVVIAQKETQLGNPGDYNIRHGSNAFGRTATSSQPNFQGAKLWYWWSSPKASIDPTAPENQRPSGDQFTYMRDVYGKYFENNDLEGLINLYAPPSENYTGQYIQQTKDRLNAMAKLAGQTVSAQPAAAAAASSSTQDLAKQMLKNKKITYWTNNGVNTRDVVVALSKGKKAYTTAANAGQKEVDINPNILRFILDAAKEGKIMVNALTDKTHTNGSNHYKGLAVDIDNNPRNTTLLTGKLIEIAKKYGGVKNSETSHFHFDFVNQPDAAAVPPQTQNDAGQLTQNSCACNPNNATTTLADTATNLPDSIPAYWRNLITNAAPKHPDSDARLVAAVLWAENRGWPDPKKNWAVSGAGAQGPWQFIPSTWANLGYDGNGDGVKDPNNPADEVHAAFDHFKGSKGKILVDGFNGDADSYFKQAVFKRDGNNLLSFAASYNGSGAPSGVKLKDFTTQPAYIADVNNRGARQNSDYVLMVYWLIASNFQKAYNPESKSFVDPARSGSPAANTGVDAAAETTSCANAANNAGADGAGVLVGEFAWPVPISFVNSNFEWFTKPHHDHPSADIPVPEGTPVYSITDGKVVYVNPTGYGGGYGTFITIDYKGALFRYQHGISGSPTVKTGDQVKAGQLIMKSGNTGLSTGPHLHVSIETGGSNPIQRSVEHCPQELFKAMKNGTQISSFESLPTTGCIGASIYN